MNYTKSQYRKDIKAAIRLIKSRDKETRDLIKTQFPNMVKIGIRDCAFDIEEICDIGWLEESYHGVKHIYPEAWKALIKAK